MRIRAALMRGPDLLTEEGLDEFLDALLGPLEEHGTHNQKDHGRRHGGGVAAGVMDEYRSTNIVSPMAPAVTDVRVGAAQIEAIASGQMSWEDYAKSNFTPEQLEELSKITTAVHANAGIPFVLAGTEGSLSPAQLATLRTAADGMLAGGMPKNTGSYKYNERLGVFIVPPDRFSAGYSAIRERVFIAAENFMGVKGAKALDEAFRDRRKVNQLRGLYSSAKSAVDIDNPLERGTAAAQRAFYRGRPAGFQVTAPLQSFISGVESAVLGARGRVSKKAATQFINDVTRRFNQPMAEGLEMVLTEMLWSNWRE